MFLNRRPIVSFCHEKNNVKLPRTAVALQEVGCGLVPTIDPDQSSL
jgi:hypothetical protein